MNVELDHFFIIVKPGGSVAEQLLSLGLEEGVPNIHQGQGTSCRRFYVSNGMIELLWVRDAREAANGPAHDLFFPDRAASTTACPFGIILRRKDNRDLTQPFSGWSYQPDYFASPKAFHIGENSSDIKEPLSIYVPFLEPFNASSEEPGTLKTITDVKITVATEALSSVLQSCAHADRLTLVRGEQHLMEITFENAMTGSTKDFRPHLPIIIHW